MELRQSTIPTTATEKPLKLEGYAVVFDTPAQIGGYSEIISRSALNNCDMSECCLIYNHDLTKIPLARVPNTLTLVADQRGLKFSAELPNTEEGKAIYESVKRGDLRGCSFAFQVSDDKFDGKQREIRTISKIYEISICPFPAYGATSVEARNKNQNQNSDEGEKKMENTNTNTSANYFGENAQKILRNVGGLDAPGNIPHFDAENVLESAEYRTAFFKNLQGKEMTAAENAAFKVARDNFAKRANEFNTATNSAALIPTDTLNEIISKARKQGGLLAECRGFSIPANVSIPVATPKDKAAWWHVEGAAVDSEKISTTNVTFSGHEILKIFSMSLKAQAMTISAFESYLVQELQACIIETIEDALVNGTGEGQGTGLLSIFTTENTFENEERYLGLTLAIGKLGRGYANGAKFAMNNKTLWTRIYSLKDYNGHPLFIQDLQNEGIGKILGFPIVVDDHLPDDTVIFGNFNYMAYNLPSGIVIESSRESSFKSGLIDYRAICIADTKPLLADAFVKLIFID